MPASPNAQHPYFPVLEDELRILFVDDDPILREFAAVHLASETAEVRTVGDGDEALAMLDRWPVDLMLLDLEMPHMDGFDVLERLAASPAHRDLPVIVVTGREDMAAIDRAFAAGATSFVSKPLNWRLLSHQIRYVRRARAAVAKAESRLADLARETGRLLDAINVGGSANLAINANDAGTTVPAPSGVGPRGGAAMLTR